MEQVFDTTEKYLYQKQFQQAIDLLISKEMNLVASMIKFNHKKEPGIEIEIQKRSMNDFERNTKDDKKSYKKIRLLCNWCTTDELTLLWTKMSNNGSWKNLQLSLEPEIPDYYVIINSPPSGVSFEPKKTIVFQMEPHMSKHVNKWKEWANPRSENFLRVFKHDKDYNNLEWHLSKNYIELKSQEIIKEKNLSKVISTVLSGKYTDPGHMKRVDFVKFLEKKEIDIHVFGNNRWNYKNYKGELPYHCKDNGIFPYKYTFNVENHEIPNYFTEKLIDGILGECLVFYSGSRTVREYIDERAYVYLELSNFEQDYDTIKKAIEDDLYTKRLPYIKEAKRKILDELQFFPRLFNELEK